MTTDFQKIKLVTDSVSDIPPDLQARWDITVVPCFVNYGGESYADDGIELVREDFYTKIGQMSETPTTSAMSPDFAKEYIDRAFEGADHLIILTTPAKLSGIHNAMRLAASTLPPERVTVIDSGQVSLGMAWQVLAAAEIAAETGNVQKTLKAIQAVRQHQALYAMIDTLEFLRRSGRVGWAAAGVGNLLQIKPVIHIENGEIVPVARVRTLSRALDKLEELALAQAPVDKLAIAHINNPEGLEMLRERLAGIAPEGTETIISTIAPAVGVHTGPGTVGFATVSKGWKDAIATGDAG
ncbi:MAG: DegV family protein [Anaerolineae bacterium]